MTIDPNIVMSKTRRLEILRDYVAQRSDATSAPDMRAEAHIIKVMKIAVEEYASHYKAQRCTPSGMTIDQLIARIERATELGETQISLPTKTVKQLVAAVIKHAPTGKTDLQIKENT